MKIHNSVNKTPKYCDFLWKILLLCRRISITFSWNTSWATEKCPTLKCDDWNIFFLHKQSWNIFESFNFFYHHIVSMLCMGTLNLTPILENSLKNPDASFLNARYCGEWEEGVKQGQGKFTYHNGDVFTVSSSYISYNICNICHGYDS